jgi:hypothetical protein
LLTVLDVEFLAKRQKFRIILDAGHEGEHFLGRMGDIVRGLVDMHERRAGA